MMLLFECACMVFVACVCCCFCESATNRVTGMYKKYVWRLCELSMRVMAEGLWSFGAFAWMVLEKELTLGHVGGDVGVVGIAIVVVQT